MTNVVLEYYNNQWNKNNALQFIVLHVYLKL